MDLFKRFFGGGYEELPATVRFQAKLQEAQQEIGGVVGSRDLWSQFDLADAQERAQERALLRSYLGILTRVANGESGQNWQKLGRLKTMRT